LQEYNQERDLSGGSCPTDSIQINSPARLSCKPTSFNTGRVTATAESGCGTGNTAWLGETCESVGQNDNYYVPDAATKAFSDVHCPTG